MSNTMIDFPDFGEVKKKLYISCPMKGRTEEAIRHDMDRLHKMAEIVFDQKLDIIPTYVKHDPPETGNKALYCLGESIKKMSEADYFIGVLNAYGARGCEIEATAARVYEIPYYFVEAYQFMPEANEQWLKELTGQTNIFHDGKGCFTGKECAPVPVCD